MENNIKKAINKANVRTNIERALKNYYIEQSEENFKALKTAFENASEVKDRLNNEKQTYAKRIETNRQKLSGVEKELEMFGILEKQYEFIRNNSQHRDEYSSPNTEKDFGF